MSIDDRFTGLDKARLIKCSALDVDCGYKFSIVGTKGILEEIIN